MHDSNRSAPLAVACLAVCWLGAPPARADVVVTRSQRLTRKGERTDWTVVRLDSGRKIYEVATNGQEVGLGPLSDNWYGNGFLALTVGKQKVNELAATLDVLERGPERGRIAVTWSLPGGKVSAELDLRDGDDKLLVTLRFPGEAEAHVRLLCYPSSFAGGYSQGKALRRKHTVTASQDIVLGDRHSTDTELSKDEPWALFMDDHFDVAKQRGSGPCAVLHFPQEVRRARARTTNYACYLDLWCEPGRDEAHLVLWDLAGLTNAAAQTYMRGTELAPAR